MAAEADSRGRSGFANQPYPQAEQFRRAYEIACQVKIASVLADGFQRMAIGKELHRRRVQALELIWANTNQASCIFMPQ